MGKRPTLADVATLAGVGTATVERVLNGRGGVSVATSQKVIAATNRLDYLRKAPGVHRRVSRIEVILVRPDSPFFDSLSTAFQRIAEVIDPSIVIHRTFAEESDPHAIARRIATSSVERSALIVAVPEHPLIRAALESVKSRGTPIVQVMSRIEGLGCPYVGIDNEAAGRMAGLLMASLQPRSGSVAVLCHSQIYGVHRDRVRGFSDSIARHAPGRLAFSQIAFTHDDNDNVNEVFGRLRHEVRDLVGLYNAGGGNPALCLALAGISERYCVIAHEVNAATSAALRQGTISVVIDQAVETQARRSLDIVLNQLSLLNHEPDHRLIRFTTVTRENL